MTLPPLMTSAVAICSAMSSGLWSESRISPKLILRFGASAMIRQRKGNCWKSCQGAAL